MSYRNDDPISGPLRFEWICEEFKLYPQVKPEISLDDFDDEALSWKSRAPDGFHF